MQKCERERTTTKEDEGKGNKLVGSHDSTEPVERIRTVSHVDTIKRDLTADKEDEKGNNRVDHLFLEGNLLNTSFRAERQVQTT